MNQSATTILKSEHQVILGVLACVESMAAEAARSGRVAVDDARDAATFLRDFADIHHHGKEEAQLFPAMEAAGFPRDGGPTGVMLVEHDQGRAHVRGMVAAIEGYGRGEAGASADYVRHARGFVSLLRQHIEKEDHCLFSMAEQAVPGPVLDQLAASFRSFNAAADASGTPAACRAIAERLTTTYAPGQPRAAAHAAHSCCDHA